MLGKSIMTKGETACGLAAFGAFAVHDSGEQGLPSLPTGVCLTRYRITLGFPLGLALSGFSGFVLHGVLGACLLEVSPPCYAALYGDDDIIRPWLITSFGNRLAHGASASFELRLFNDATRFLPDLIGALMLAGCAGLGPERSPFDVVSVETLLPGQSPRALDLGSGAVPLAQPLTAWCAASTKNTVMTPIRVLFTSPAALKQGNELVRTPPPFGLIIARTLARLSLLAKTRLLDAPQKQHLLAAANAVEALGSTVRWQEEERYSGRQRRTMPFGGLVGETLFSVAASPFAPWLDAAAVLGIGGKTTFGFGQLNWRHEG